MDGYVLVNLDAFVKVVDLVGGVTVNVPQDMYYSDPSQDLLIDLKAGEQKLDGKQAMGLVRFRRAMPRRISSGQRCSRKFLKALAKQCLSLENLTAAKNCRNMRKFLKKTSSGSQRWQYALFLRSS